eukprot:Skav216245  [mRNA]  locus=scaffold20:42649:50187:- [translate_table: standard]
MVFKSLLKVGNLLLILHKVCHLADPTKFGGPDPLQSEFITRPFAQLDIPRFEVQSSDHLIGNHLQASPYLLPDAYCSFSILSWHHGQHIQHDLRKLIIALSKLCKT